MRALLCLVLSVALLCSLVFADHHGDHGKKGSSKGGHKKKDDHEPDHSKKGNHHHHHNHGHDHKDHHHSNETWACHKLAAGNLQFAFEIFRQVTADHPSENVVISPISISTALALLSLGARGNTHDQIIEGIGFNISEISEKEIHDGFHHLLDVLNNDESGLHLDTGNGLFISKAWKLLDKFLDDAKNLYASEGFTVDFQDNEGAKKQINSYIEKKTNGKLTDVLSSVDKEAALLLVNFIYFRGKWEVPFEEEYTSEGDFHVSDKVTVKVPFMSRTGRYQVAFLGDATVVNLPYKGNASALFILPKDGKIKEVEGHFQNTVKKYKKSNRKMVVGLQIPRFSISGSLELKDVLAKLGIVDLFSDSADLTGVTGAPNLKVSKAIHKAKISIDEKGTEAAATTVVEAIPMSLPPTITFNHPFILSVYDHASKTVLFFAKIANPEK
ncbi:alpha-1-antiproteinase-like [Hyperolius riggenbachi]|uniref:alpha-1-antiproteinase-like n=1 Tax=Hyperolius riggenbachi TaxID=752182 RepID=UPI0035A389A4